MEKQRIVVIGGGPGGYVAAIRAAKLGGEVTLVEKDALGGTCLNVGCIPTKSLLHTAELYHEVKTRGEKLGIVANDISVDYAKVHENKSEVVARLCNGVAALMKMNKITVIKGMASFVNESEIEIVNNDGEKQKITADKFIIASGSKNIVPNIQGIANASNIIDSTDALDLRSAPKSLLVVGGGVIGVELASALSAFGTKVTIVEMMDRVLPLMDTELSKLAGRILKQYGIETHLSTSVVRFEGDKAICKNAKGEEFEIDAEKTLISVGRTAQTADLKLENTGVKTNGNAIVVDEKMQTCTPNIYAIGDCISGYPQLAHTASFMGEVAAENAMGLNVNYDGNTTPSCVYMSPEIASVGITEQTAIEQGLDYCIGKFNLMANGKAYIMNDGVGLVKFVAEKSTGKILGLHILGPRASEMIAQGSLAIKTGATLHDVCDTIYAHPSVSESIREAALSALGKAVHGR